MKDMGNSRDITDQRQEGLFRLAGAHARGVAGRYIDEITRELQAGGVASQSVARVNLPRQSPRVSPPRPSPASIARVDRPRQSLSAGASRARIASRVALSSAATAAPSARSRARVS